MNLLCIATFLLTATPEESFLSSEHASYNGEALKLEGHVLLDHGLGTLQAEHATFHKQSLEDDLSFASMDLANNVVLLLKNNSTLKCSSAHLDFEKLKGHLASNSETVVSYEGTLLSQEGKIITFTLEGALMDLAFVKNSFGSKDLYGLDSLQLHKSVKLRYGEDMFFFAENALYEARNPFAKDLSGILKTASLNVPCLLVHFEDRVEANSITIDLDKELLSLESPHGTCSSSFTGHAEPLCFSADHLFWDRQGHTLSLQGHILLAGEHLGALSSSGEVFLQQDLSGRLIQEIKMTGYSTLTSKQMKLSSYESLHVDGIQGIITLDSKENQISYQDDTLTLQADHACVTYTQNSSYALEHLVLEDHIRLQTASSIGLADRATYDPKTKTAILTALPKKRVLFMDEEQGIRMSALEVRLSSDPVTGKMQIQGIGQVNFSLSDEESSLLQKCKLQGL